MFVVCISKFQKISSEQAADVWGSGTGPPLQLLRNYSKILHTFITFLMPFCLKSQYFPTKKKKKKI